jgi:hypothetical protein
LNSISGAGPAGCRNVVIQWEKRGIAGLFTESLHECCSQCSLSFRFISRRSLRVFHRRIAQTAEIEPFADKCPSCRQFRGYPHEYFRINPDATITTRIPTIASEPRKLDTRSSMSQMRYHGMGQALQWELEAGDNNYSNEKHGMRFLIKD